MQGTPKGCWTLCCSVQWKVTVQASRFKKREGLVAWFAGWMFQGQRSGFTASVQCPQNSQDSCSHLQNAGRLPRHAVLFRYGGLRAGADFYFLRHRTRPDDDFLGDLGLWGQHSELWPVTLVPQLNRPGQGSTVQLVVSGVKILHTALHPTGLNPPDIRFQIQHDDAQLHQPDSPGGFSDAKPSRKRASSYLTALEQHALVTGLVPGGNRYFYTVGGGACAVSDVFNFSSHPGVGADIPVTFAMMGDLGQTNNSQGTLDHVAAHAGDFAAIMHFGDLSYADGNETRWDSWGRLVQVWAPLQSSCRGGDAPHAAPSLLAASPLPACSPSLPACHG